LWGPIAEKVPIIKGETSGAAGVTIREFQRVDNGSGGSSSKQIATEPRREMTCLSGYHNLC
jgi:hypothetical protein